jgi:hypothetical protein
MRIKKRVLQKFVSLLSSALLLLNSFSPYLLIAPTFVSSVKAQEPTISQTQDPTPTDSQTNQTPVSDPTSTPTPTTTTSTQDNTNPTATPTPTTVSAVTETPTPTPTTAQSTQADNNVNSSSPAQPASTQPTETPTPTPEEKPLPVPTPTPVEQACLTNEQLRDTTNDDWNIDLDKGTSETKEKVKLGLTYLFPQENKVTVKFKCLPKDENLRMPLKIQKVKVSDLNLPAEIKPYGEYAYDITTGMADGSFDYDITLPKPTNQVAEVSYMETKDSGTQTIPVGDTNQEGDKVKANSLDHFTIFFVSTTMSVFASFSGASQVTVYPGTLVDVTMNVDLTNGTDWRYSAYQIEGGALTGINTPNDTTNGSANFSEKITIAAPTAPGTYDLTLVVYSNDSQSGSSATTTLPDAIIVTNNSGIPFTETFGSSNSALVTNWYETEPAEIFSGTGNDAPTSGQFAKIGNDGWICRSFDATGTANVQINYDWKGNGNNSNDQGIVEYKIGGSCGDDVSSWTNLGTHALTNTSWGTESNTFTGNNIFNLRFRTHGAESGEYFRVDNISLSAATFPDLTAVKTNDVSGNATTNVPFNWKIRVQNSGSASASFASGNTILTDNLPNNNVTYGSTTVTKSDGTVTGTISCSINSSENLVCTASGGSVVIPAGKYFDVSFPTTFSTTGSKVNPRTGTGSPVCKVDANNAVTESDDSNNTCSDTVTVANVQTATNPTLPQACGLDIALVLDSSGSIDSGELTSMKNAFKAFVDALLPSTPTQFSVTDFDDTAAVVQGFSSNATTVKNAIDAPTSGGSTNWQDGLLKAQTTLHNRVNPDLVIFASDGNPNTIGNGNSVTETQALNAAVLVANDIKTTSPQTRIIALGIGNDLNIDNLKAISGPTVGTNLSADVITSDFSTLATTLATFASQTCGGTITVKKEVTGQANPTLSGWHFTVNGNDYVTDSQGFTQAIPVTSGTYSVVETTQSGYSLATKTCTKNNSATGSPITNGVGSISVGANDIVSCTFTNSYNPVCGDGVVNGTEQCDAGNQNGVACTAGYGLTCNYCSANCTNATVTGPSCGDGIKNGSEQCDGTDLGGLSSSEFSCTGQCGLNLIDPKVTICHAADSQTNPYITNQPNKSADVGGHDGHTGPIWYPGIADHGWGDIIPPFNYIGGSYPGKNWTTEGQAIYDAGCNIPKGHLVVKKTTIPSGDLTSFTISATSSNGGTITGGGSGTVTDANDKNYEVTPGTYSVTETVPEGWEETSNTCSNIAVGMGETKDCLITNTKKPKLTVTKVVVNDNGGKKVVSDFPLFVGDTEVTSGVTNYFDAGDYTVTENPDSGYAKSYSGDCGPADGSITLAAGDNKTCTITNDDKPGTLIVKKVLTQDNGGQKAAIGFSFIVNGGDSTPFEADGQNNLTVNAGTYTVVEDSTTSAGYSVTTDNCTDVVVPNGGTQTCTITNDDIAPKLTLVKEVDNRDGGTATPSAWTLSATEVTPGTTDTSFSGAGPTVGPQDVDAASSYVLSESAGPSGYSAGAWDCDGGSVVTGADTRITLGVGDNVTCTIKNDDIAPKLTINKVCSPTGDSGKFNLQINGLTKKEDAACGDSTGAVAVTAGKNTFGETNGTGTVLSEYKSTLSGTDCVDKDGNYEITLAVGDDKTCTITNTKNARIIVKKETNPDKSSQLFDFTANFSGDVFSLKDGESKDSGYSLTPGSSYHVSETGVEGWDQTDATCDNGDKIDNIIPSAGQTVTCTFTNTQRGTISGYKYNDADGSDSTTGDRTPIENWTIQLYQWVTDAYQYLTSTLTNVLGLFTFNNLVPGQYQVQEVVPTAGWTPVSPTGIPVTLGAGDEKKDNNFVNFQNATIVVHKNVVKPDGTTEVEDTKSFTALLNDGTPKTIAEGTNATYSDLTPGTYTVSEDTVPTGYALVSITDDDSTTPEGQVAVTSGHTNNVYITNRQLPATLTLIKNLPNDNGGTATESNFKVYINDVESTWGEHEVDPGTYTVKEDSLAGYTPSDWSNGCNSKGEVTLLPGQSKTCEITNDDEKATLIVKKHVVNDDGGNKSATNFTMSVTGTNVSDTSFAGDEDGTSVTLDAGRYSVGETELTGYARSDSEDCSGTIANGETKTCTITNDDIAPKLTLIKEVTNDNGGTAGANEFGLTIGDESVNSGETKVLSANTAYSINEAGLTGYKFVSITGDENCPSELGGNITLNPGDDVTCTINNDDELAHLIVKKHVINDNGGTKNASDFTMSVEGQNVSTPSFAGDEEGTEVTLDAGNYNVTESGPVGYLDSYSSQCKGTIANGETKTCTIINNDQFGSVTVTKFNDLNGNGKQDEGEPTLPDWKIKLSGNGTEDTNVDGVATFAPVLPGTYSLDEIMQKGWNQTVISCSQNNQEPTPTPTPTGTNEEGTPTPTPTTEESSNICHWNEGSDKWNALSVPLTNNGHEGHELDFEYLGFTDSKGKPVKDSHNKDNPDLNGDAWCEVNNPGNRVQNIFGISKVEAVTRDSEGYQVTVPAEENVDCIIGNQQINPTLEISKSNDGFNKSQGSTVVYTLKVKAKDSKVLGVKLKDLLPKGFSFQHVISIIKNGVDDITSLVGDPAYHSPGTYNLGDMNEEDEIIIKYQAKVGDSQKFGIYKDVAWAEGTDAADRKVLALAQPEGKVSDNFVGTSVKVDGTISDQGSTTIAKEEGQVLGASTSLPATGASPAWLILALLLTVFGTISRVFGLMFKKGKIILTSLFMVMLFMFAGQVDAASSVSIRLSEPKTPTKTNNFTIDFVTLDLSDSGNPLTVKCFYKKNLGDGWTQYGPDISVAAPGNSGSCQEVSSFVNASETTYYFKATATNGVDSDDTEFQGLVSVGYDNRGPSAPTNYTKEKISSCQYKISFKTADDGMTSRVEIYRSENTTMTLDGSTKAGEVAVGPNTSSRFTDTVPDCSKSYYYVIRAFNVQGNSSAAIGDSVTISSGTTTTTTSTTSGAIPVVNVTLPAGSAGTGAVLGEETKKEGSKEAEPQKKEEVINVEAKKDVGSVLGAITKKENRLPLIIGSILGLAIIGYVIYYFKKKKQNPQV